MLQCCKHTAGAQLVFEKEGREGEKEGRRRKERKKRMSLHLTLQLKESKAAGNCGVLFFYWAL